MPVTRKVRRVVKEATQPVTEFRIPGPEDLNEPSDKLLDYSITIFGEKGIGKTSLAASFPGSLTLMTEPLRKNLKIRQVPIRVKPVKLMNKDQDAMTAWDMIKASIEQGLEDDSVSCIVADTIDRVYDACRNHHCFQIGISDPNEMKDYGATWRAISDDFEETLNQVRLGGKGLILISHAQLREVEARNGSSYDLCIPTCAKAAFQYIKAACDYAFYFGYYDKKRALYLRGNDLIWSACGVDDHFCDPDGTPIDVLQVSNNPQQAYQDLIASWNNEKRDISYIPPVKKKLK